MKWNSRTRCTIICVAFTALFSAFSFRLVYLQIIKHEEYSGLAAEKQGSRQTIHAERGAIYVVSRSADGAPVRASGVCANAPSRQAPAAIAPRAMPPCNAFLLVTMLTAARRPSLPVLSG